MWPRSGSIESLPMVGCHPVIRGRGGLGDSTARPYVQMHLRYTVQTRTVTYRVVGFAAGIA